jgi:uroporphyrinogen decarboxylase
MRVAPMNSRFLDACRRRPTDVRPVWFMRQAGRYMKQYRDIRAKHGILEICKRPELAAQSLCSRWRFWTSTRPSSSPICLLPVEPHGFEAALRRRRGARSSSNPVRTSSDVDSLSISNTDELGYVGEAIQLVVRATGRARFP